jgi:hypothetical protein
MRLDAGPVLAVIAVACSAMPLAGQRTVLANEISSLDRPVASIAVDPAMEYVGVSSFVLYGVADVELHLFVEAEGGRVRRLLWIQFEGYREDNNHTYDYSGDPTRDIGGRPFHINARFYPASGFGGRTGSDGDHARRLLESKGYELGTDLARVRLVWLLNDPPRDELMLIYLEDLADHGLNVGTLRGDPTRWATLARQLEERAGRSFQIDTLQTAPEER